MAQYVLTKYVAHPEDRNKRRAPGELVDLTEEEAKPLLQSRVIRKPTKQESDAAKGRAKESSAGGDTGEATESRQSGSEGRESGRETRRRS